MKKLTLGRVLEVALKVTAVLGVFVAILNCVAYLLGLAIGVNLGAIMFDALLCALSASMCLLILKIDGKSFKQDK